jgi:hypothetical protein
MSGTQPVPVSCASTKRFFRPSPFVPWVPQTTRSMSPHQEGGLPNHYSFTVTKRFPHSLSKYSPNDTTHSCLRSCWTNQRFHHGKCAHCLRGGILGRLVNDGRSDRRLYPLVAQVRQSQDLGRLLGLCQWCHDIHFLGGHLPQVHRGLCISGGVGKVLQPPRDSLLLCGYCGGSGTFFTAPCLLLASTFLTLNHSIANQNTIVLH